MKKNKIKRLKQSYGKLNSVKEIETQTSNGSSIKTNLFEFIKESIIKYFPNVIGNVIGKEDSNFNCFMNNLRTISNNFTLNNIYNVNNIPLYVFEVFNDKNGNIQYQIAFYDSPSVNISFFVKNKIRGVTYNKKHNLCVFSHENGFLSFNPLSHFCKLKQIIEKKRKEKEKTESEFLTDNFIHKIIDFCDSNQIDFNARGVFYIETEFALNHWTDDDYLYLESFDKELICYRIYKTSEFFKLIPIKKKECFKSLENENQIKNAMDSLYNTQLACDKENGILYYINSLKLYTMNATELIVKNSYEFESPITYIEISENTVIIGLANGKLLIRSKESHFFDVGNFTKHSIKNVFVFKFPKTNKKNNKSEEFAAFEVIIVVDSSNTLYVLSFDRIDYCYKVKKEHKFFLGESENELIYFYHVSKGEIEFVALNDNLNKLSSKLK